MEKIAFLFLTRHEHKQEAIWEHYLRNADERKLSIYIHPDHDKRMASPYFSRYEVANKVPKRSAWTLDAQLILLAHAFQDESNIKFMLLSEDCIPCMRFDDLYEFMISEPRSIMQHRTIWFGPEEQRYVRELPAGVQLWNADWPILTRKHAALALSGGAYYETMRCYPVAQEHYYATLFNIAGCLGDDAVLCQQATEEDHPHLAQDLAVLAPDELRKRLSMNRTNRVPFVRKFLRPMDPHIMSELEIA